jgi:5-methylcytosine-specific restriction endonuclease McrA
MSSQPRLDRWRTKHHDTFLRIQRESNRRRRAERRLKIIEFFGGQCQNCGFEDSRALQVHHKEGLNGEKRLLSPELWSWIQRHQSEARRELELLCANCHAIHTYETVTKNLRVF